MPRAAMARGRSGRRSNREARVAVPGWRWPLPAGCAPARRAGLAVPDRVFGLAESGRMDAGAMARAVAGLEGGLNEIYLHPATRDEWPGHAPGYRYRDEMDALLDPAVIAGVAKAGADLGPFARFAAAGAGLAGVGA
jgi:hypothetical protein